MSRGAQRCPRPGLARNNHCADLTTRATPRLEQFYALRAHPHAMPVANSLCALEFILSGHVILLLPLGSFPNARSDVCTDCQNPIADHIRLEIRP